MIRLKGVYEPPDPSDGFRVLVDRLWPRGLWKEKARIGGWRKDLGPSDALRRWFGHDPRKWIEFRRRYLSELRAKQGEVEDLAEQVRQRTITLLYAAADEKYNNAVVLKEVLDKHS
jgi:uncharacterized protein YeaO (DUF488 family)